MIKAIANVEQSPLYSTGTFAEFQEWLLDRLEYQLDVETNVTDTIIDNKLRTIQFGTFDPRSPVKVQWIIEWLPLTKEQKIWILTQIARLDTKKYIQNATFEQGVFLNYNLVLENVWDTMLNEKIIYTGYGAVLDEDGATFFSLEGICRRRLGVDLDKSYQLLFGHEIPLTPGHIVYAAQDVMWLDDIIEQQDIQLEQHYGTVPVQDRTVFNHLPTLENEAVLAFGDISYNGMKVDQDKWRRNAEEAQPIVDKYKAVLDEYLITDEKLHAQALKLGIIADRDLVEINWNSVPQKLQLLQHAFPDLEGASKPMLKKYLKNLENEGALDSAAYTIIYEMFENSNYQPFFDMMLEHCRDFLVEKQFLIPAGTIRINWNSTTAVIPLLQCIVKSLESTKEEVLNKFPHPIAFAILDYRGALMLTSSFGIKFLNKLDHDGKVRTQFNQILETGRVSSAKPNMQQIPIIDDDDPVIANKYRNCFIADDDSWVFADSDYSSQELVIIASLSGDPVWMEALRAGHDLHSICAQLVHGAEWDRHALPTCKFKLERQKCKCPGHSRLRNGIKTINFGLAYGMSQFKLAATLKITVKEAEALIEKYFETFPKIKGKLTALGRFAIRNGYIQTLAPYFRKRWYPLWHKVKDHIEEHVQEIKRNSLLGSIERTGKNTPIQGGSADMTKLALVLIRRYINDNNLRGTVKIVMTVHDQVTTLVKKQYAEAWQIKLTELMEQAAKVVIPSGLLKADTQLTLSWSK